MASLSYKDLTNTGLDLTERLVTAQRESAVGALEATAFN